MRFRPLTSARDKPAIVVAVVVSIAFIAGAVYFYKVPTSLLLGYLLNLIIILVGLMLLALTMVVVLVLLRKLFARSR